MAVPFPRSPAPLIVLGCLFGVATLSLHAQQLPGQPQVLPAPALPLVPENAVLAPLPPEKSDVNVTFVNSTIVDILHYYEELSHKHVLYDTSVTGGQITIDVKNVTRTDALRIIETALNLNGITLIPDDNNIIKVLGLGKPVRNAGLPIYADLATLPDSIEVVTYILRLTYLDPQETAGVLTQYIPPTSAIGFTPLKSANALLITDTARNVRRLVGLISRLDVPASPVTEKFISLKRAEVTKAVEFLNSVFDTKSGGSGGSGGVASGQPTNIAPNNNATRRPIRRVGEDGQAVDIPGITPFATAGGLPVLSGDGLIQGRVTLTPDIRTNRIHVVATPHDLHLIEELLEEFDADTPFAAPVRRPLRFVTAADMLPILVDSLKEQGADNNNSSNPNSTGTSPTRQNNNTSSFFGNNSNNSTNGSSSSGGLNGSGSGSSSIGNDAQTPEVDTRPTEATVGNNKLIADQRTNTIILLGGADAKDKVFKVLDQLDVRTPQVVIRTVIGEMALDNNRELGFQYLLRSNRGSLVSQFNPGLFNGSTATAAATPASSPTTGTSALNTFGTIATGLSSSFTGVGGILAIGKSLDIIVSALESTSRFKTISRPMIVTSNNKQAFIFSGTEVPIPTGSVGSLNTTGASTGVYSNIELQEVGIKLQVTPLINSEKEVTLDIAQEINSLSGGSTTVNGSAIPNIAKRELSNHISARNGETIVLGGLITQNDNRGSSDIPYLSRIPLIGDLFKSKTKDVSRNELIILLHPEVVNTAGIMVDVRESEEARTYLGHDLEDQLLPTFPVRKALPVTQTQKTTTKTTSTYTPDDKLHPASKKATVQTRRTTSTTTTRQDN